MAGWRGKGRTGKKRMIDKCASQCKKMRKLRERKRLTKEKKRKLDEQKGKIYQDWVRGWRGKLQARKEEKRDV